METIKTDFTDYENDWNMNFYFIVKRKIILITSDMTWLMKKSINVILQSSFIAIMINDKIIIVLRWNLFQQDGLL